MSNVLIVKKMNEMRPILEAIERECTNCEAFHKNETEARINKSISNQEDLQKEKCDKCLADRVTACKSCEISLKQSLSTSPAQQILLETPTVVHVPSLVPANFNPYDFCLEQRKKWFGSDKDETFEVFLAREKTEHANIEEKK